ncbi:MAG: hypothetical protein V4710_18490 [Verrucomicrobiota bacterium]
MDEFLLPLGIQPGEVESAVADRGPWQSGLVYFSSIEFSEIHHNTSADAGARSEAFYARVHEAFLNTSRFLARRSPGITETMRAAGLSLRFFIELDMDQDQMEIELPPELLTACSQHHLGIHLISNDNVA